MIAVQPRVTWPWRPYSWTQSVPYRLRRTVTLTHYRGNLWQLHGQICEVVDASRGSWCRVRFPSSRQRWEVMYRDLKRVYV